MKRSKMLFLSVFASFLAIATFSGVMAAKNTQHVEKAEAATTTTYDIYCTKSFNFLIDDIRVHQWGGTTPGTTWGWDTFSKMDKVFDNESGQPVFKLTIPSDRTGLIFVSIQDGNLKQTVNVESNIKNNQGWYFSGWSGSNMTVGTWTVKPYTINYYGNGSTSGSMPSETAYANVSWGLTDNAFSKTGYQFSGWNTSSDGSGTSYSNKALVAKNYASTTLNLYAQWTKYYPTGRYIVGSFCGWSIEGAVYMGATSQYSATNVPLSFGDEFKIANYNGTALESFYGYSSSVGGGLFCFSQVTTADESYDNFKCWATGLYNFYFSDIEYETGKKTSVEISGTKWNAEQLAAKLMSYGEYVGHCGDEDRFPLCKGKFLEMDSGEKTTFEGYGSSSETQFKNAYLRYTSWASALGQKPFEEGSVNSAYLNLIFGGQNSSNTTIIVVVVVGVAALAVGGYFLLRKKKEN